jgi:nucleolar protein TMA23
MDAKAYLLRHGWSGPGNPLNPDRSSQKRVGGPHGGLGLTRPILISRKQNLHGVGKKTTKDPTNQWWLRGFEEALRGVGTENNNGKNDGCGNVVVEGNSLAKGRSELYKYFVRGEGLPGTITRHKDIKTENKRFTGVVMTTTTKMEKTNETKITTISQIETRVLATDPIDKSREKEKKKEERVKNKKRKRAQLDNEAIPEKKEVSHGDGHILKEPDSKRRRPSMRSDETTSFDEQRNSKRKAEKKARKEQKIKSKNVTGEDETKEQKLRRRSKRKEKRKSESQDYPTPESSDGGSDEGGIAKDKRSSMNDKREKDKRETKKVEESGKTDANPKKRRKEKSKH